MSPQRSNRQALLEGALQCIEAGPSARITARQIAAASGASIGSIRYHFGSTDALVAMALDEGFQRWLTELSGEMGELREMNTLERIQLLSEIVSESVQRHEGLVRSFLAALARAPHDSELRAILGERHRHVRLDVVSLLELGEDDAGEIAAALLHATFDGLLIQAMLNPDDVLAGEEMGRGIMRLARIGRRSTSMREAISLLRGLRRGR